MGGARRHVSRPHAVTVLAEAECGRRGVGQAPPPTRHARSSSPQCMLLDKALESQRFELPMKRPAGQRCDGPCRPCPGFRNDKRGQVSVEAARADAAAQARVPSVKCKGEFSGKKPVLLSAAPSPGGARSGAGAWAVLRVGVPSTHVGAAAVPFPVDLLPMCPSALLVGFLGFTTHPF